MQIKVAKCRPEAKLPTYATPAAFCFDLYAAEEGAVDGNPISTGLKFEIPEGYGMLIFSRSGHGFKRNIQLANCVGVIDSDYRGEVMVKLVCNDRRVRTPFEIIRAGERIAQAAIVPRIVASFLECETLTETDRGENGFGSTGS